MLGTSKAYVRPTLKTITVGIWLGLVADCEFCILDGIMLLIR